MIVGVLSVKRHALSWILETREHAGGSRVIERQASPETTYHRPPSTVYARLNRSPSHSTSLTVSSDPAAVATLDRVFDAEEKLQK
jgi:hypothetical protein